MVNSPSHIRSEYASPSTCSDGERIYSARGDMMMVEKCSEMNFVLAARSRMSGFDDSCKNPVIRSNSDITFQKFHKFHKPKLAYHELDKKGLYQEVCRMKEQLHISRKLQNKTRGEKEQLVSHMVDSVLNPTVECRVVYRSLKQVSLRLYERLVTILGPRNRQIPTCMAYLDSQIARFGRICANSGLLVRCFRDWRGRRGRCRWVMSLASNFVNRMRMKELRAVMMSWKARTKQLKYLRKIIARASASELENMRPCFLFAWHTYARSQVVRRKQVVAQTRIINSLITLRRSQLLAHTFHHWLLHTRDLAHLEHTHHAIVRRIYYHWQALAREQRARMAHKQRFVKEVESRWEREKLEWHMPRIFKTWHHHTLMRAYVHRILGKYGVGRNTHAFTSGSVFHAWRLLVEARERELWRRNTLERTILRRHTWVEQKMLRQAWVDWGDLVKEARMLKRTLRDMVMNVRKEDEYVLQVTLHEWARLCISARRSRDHLDTVLRSPLLAHRLFIGTPTYPPLHHVVFGAWVFLLRRSQYAELLKKRLHLCYRPAYALTTEGEARPTSHISPLFFCISSWTCQTRRTTPNPSLHDSLLLFCVSEWKRVTRDRRFTRSRVFSTFFLLKTGRSVCDEVKSYYMPKECFSLRWVFSFWSRYAWRRRLHYSALCHASIISSHASVVRQKDIFGAWKQASVETKYERRMELLRSRMKARLCADMCKADECTIRHTFYAWIDILKRRRQCIKVLTTTNTKARVIYTNIALVLGLRLIFFTWKYEVRDSKIIHQSSLSSRIFLREILRHTFLAWIDILKRRRQRIKVLTTNTKARYYTNIALVFGLRLVFFTWKHEVRDSKINHHSSSSSRIFLRENEKNEYSPFIEDSSSCGLGDRRTGVRELCGNECQKAADLFMWRNEVDRIRMSREAVPTLSPLRLFSCDITVLAHVVLSKWRHYTTAKTKHIYKMPVSDEEQHQSKLQQWEWRVEQTLGPVNVSRETDMSRSESTTDVDNPQNSCLPHHLSLGKPSIENCAMRPQKEKLSLDKPMYENEDDARLSAETYSPTTRLRWCERRLNAFFHTTTLVHKGKRKST